MQVRMEGLSSRMMCGQVQQVTLHVRNTGPLPLQRLRVAASLPQFFTFSRSNMAAAHDVTSVYPTKPEPCETDSHEQVGRGRQ